MTFPQQHNFSFFLFFIILSIVFIIQSKFYPNKGIIVQKAKKNQRDLLNPNFYISPPFYIS
jgi:hypothetical protein